MTGTFDQIQSRVFRSGSEKVELEKLTPDRTRPSSKEGNKSPITKTLKDRPFIREIQKPFQATIQSHVELISQNNREGV